VVSRSRSSCCNPLQQLRHPEEQEQDNRGVMATPMRATLLLQWVTRPAAVTRG
jgi:hypothetical protein